MRWSFEFGRDAFAPRQALQHLVCLAQRKPVPREQARKIDRPRDLLSAQDQPDGSGSGSGWGFCLCAARSCERLPHDNLVDIGFLQQFTPDGI